MTNPTRYYSSTASKTTLASPISSTDLSLQLSAASNLPILYPYTLILEKDTANEEVVQVNSLVGSSYQIQRNIDGSGAKSHAFGATVEHGVSARDFTESRAHEAASIAHDTTSAIVGINDVQTLTNKTLTAPKFADNGFLADANGNEIVVLDTVASAVNEVTVANAATAGKPTISATGGDTNITLNLVSKGTGTVQANAVDVVTTTGSQTLTNKTLTSPTINNPALILPNASTASEGRIGWLSASDQIVVGDGTVARIISPDDKAATISNKTLGSNLAAGTFKITGLGDPTSAQDAATKNYVDNGVTSQVNQAATSATSASNSATAAASSALAASTSATSASNSQTAAAASALAASTSATSASNSASAAVTSASSASTSAASAVTSATSAAASAASLTDSNIQISFQVFG